MDEKLFISRQNWHFSFVDNMIKMLFPLSTSTWLVKDFASRQAKGINRRIDCTKNTIICLVETVFNPLYLSLLSLKNISLLDRKTMSCQKSFPK